MAKISKRPASRTKHRNRPIAFPVEFRLRIVNPYLEEGYNPKLLVGQFGVSTHSSQHWVRVYRRWIHDLAAELSTRAGKSAITTVAYRLAARQWLVKNGLIRIQKAGEVSPDFCQKSDHN
jgi:transposase-like protein